MEDNIRVKKVMLGDLFNLDVFYFGGFGYSVIGNRGDGYVVVYRMVDGELGVLGDWVEAEVRRVEEVLYCYDYTDKPMD